MHVTTHDPLTQDASCPGPGAGQRTPHLPQFIGSDVTGTQLVPHRALPSPHAAPSPAVASWRSDACGSEQAPIANTIARPSLAQSEPLEFVIEASLLRTADHQKIERRSLSPRLIML